MGVAQARSISCDRLLQLSPALSVTVLYRPEGLMSQQVWSSQRATLGQQPLSVRLLAQRL